MTGVAPRRVYRGARSGRGRRCFGTRHSGVVLPLARADRCLDPLGGRHPRHIFPCSRSCLLNGVSASPVPTDSLFLNAPIHRTVPR